MTSFLIRVIALLAMTLDHVACNLSAFPGIYYPFRIIGRIAFPIFCFLIAEGYRKTSNPYKYMLRLAVAALISEIPFNLCFGHDTVASGSVNVMFTLLLGLVAIFAIDRISRREKLAAVAVIPAILLVCVAELIKSDYGAGGVILIILFYLTRTDTLRGKLFASLWTLVFGLRFIIEYAIMSPVKYLLSLGTTLAPIAEKIVAEAPNNWDILQIFAVLAVIPILLYNGKPGPVPEKKLNRKLLQYAFYLYYPVHLTVIWLFTSVIK